MFKKFLQKLRSRRFDSIAAEYSWNFNKFVNPAPVSFNIFVFGSNEAGLHHGGAAKFAMDFFGALYMLGYGMYGKSFAIPTMDKDYKPLSVSKIRWYAEGFIAVAKENPHLKFHLTPIGCGIAGYQPEDIAGIFLDVPKNVILPGEFFAPIMKRRML